MDQRTAFTVKAYANSSPPFFTAERQHEFADCVQALDDYCAYCVSGIQIMQVYKQEFVTLQENIH
jgi:hypothetical protein